MTASLVGRDLLSAADLSADEVGVVFERAVALKAEFLAARRHATPPLVGRTLAMLFQKPSLRTRVTFEAGMVQLGGHAIYLTHDVVLGARALEVEGHSGEKVRLRVHTPTGARTIEGSDVLVAAGRVPNTQGIGLETAGIELDARGYIKVNERLETTAPHVWALGDCAGSPQFTHVAFDDFRIVRDNLNGGARTTLGRLVPYCMFTDPELGRVGLSESEAQREGIAYRVVKTPMAAVLRTRTLSETRGFLKALIAAQSDHILGFTALGVQAGELIAVVQTAMLANVPYTALRDAILTHPTIAEGLTVLFAGEPESPREENRLV